MKTLMRQGALIGVLSVLVSLTNLSWCQDSSESLRKVLVKTQAVYPTLAQSMHIHGVVKLIAHVAPNGSVKSIDVKGGHPILTQSAITAVGHWKFESGPKETNEDIEIKFDPQ